MAHYPLQAPGLQALEWAIGKRSVTVPRYQTETCPIRVKLFQETSRTPSPDARRWGYAGLAVFGSRAPQPMKRLNVQGDSASYKAIGYICEKGHVVLNEPGEEAQHLVPSTFAQPLSAWRPGRRSRSWYEREAHSAVCPFPGVCRPLRRPTT